MRIPFQLAIAALIAVLATGGWYLLRGGAAQESSATGPRGGAAPVEVVTASAGELIETVEAVGTARAHEAIRISPKASGRIASIHFDEGQRVAAGELLAELDNRRELAELREAEANLRDAQAQYRRASSLSVRQDVSEAHVEQQRAAADIAQARVDAARARLEDTRITAPFAGMLGLRTFSIGAFVDPQTSLTTLDDLSTLRIDFGVPERFMTRLQQGRTVFARSAGFPGEVFSGSIRSVDTRIDPVSRTVRVQAELPNAEARLRPGMFLAVELVLDERPQAIMIPEQALVVEGDARYVYRVDEDDIAHRVAVLTGLRRDGQLEIVEGVTVGERIVISGTQRVRDQGPVRVRTSAASE